MQLIPITLAAGETKRFEIAGRYMEIIDSDSAVTLLFFDASGGQVDGAVGALSGLYVEESFKAFTIYSATAQKVTLMVTDGRGGSRRQPGNVRVINRVQTLCRQLVSTNLVVVDQVVAIVTPAANVNGVIIRSVGLTAQPLVAGSSSVQVFGASFAPANGTAAEASVATAFCLISRATSFDPAVLAQRFEAGLQIELPPGIGLYLGRINTVAAAACSVRVSYEVNV